MTTTKTTPSLAALILAFAAIYVVWGSTYLGIRIAIETMPPFLMAGARFVLAGLPLFLVARLRGAPWPSAREWRAAALVGTLMLFGGNGLVTWAEQRIASGVAAVLIATVPLFMALFDRLFFGGPRFGALTAPGIVIGLVGVSVLMSGGAEAAGEGIDVVGGATVLLASALWATGSLASRRAALPPSPILTSGMQMLAGGAVMLGVGSISGEWARVDVGGFSTRSLVAFAYLVVFGSILALSAYVWLLRVTSARAVSTYAFVNPLVAVLLGWAIVGERVDMRTAVASGLIVLAVLVLYGVGPRRRPRPNENEGPRPEARALVENGSVPKTEAAV